MKSLFSIDHKTNCIRKWRIPNAPKPLQFSGWGCEVGNWFGFFSQERLDGTACKIKDKHIVPIENDNLQSIWHIDIPHASLLIKVQDLITSPTRIIRQLKIQNRSQGTSWVGDMVIRTVIPWEDGLIAHINNEFISHNDDNLYRDTEDASVALQWFKKQRVSFRWLEKPTDFPSFTPYLYLRAQPAMPQFNHEHSNTRAWVIHARLLVDYPAAYVYRIARNPFVFWSRGFIGRYIISMKQVKQRWRASEWTLPGRGSLYGVWPLRQNEEIKMSIEIIYE